jgi:hypothetical protein
MLGVVELGKHGEGSELLWFGLCRIKLASTIDGNLPLLGVGDMREDHGERG